MPDEVDSHRYVDSLLDEDTAAPSERPRMAQNSRTSDEPQGSSLNALSGTISYLDNYARDCPQTDRFV